MALQSCVTFAMMVTTLRQNYWKLLVIFIIILSAMKLMTLPLDRSTPQVLTEIQSFPHGSKQEFLQMFNKENTQMILDVVRKLSHLLNKTNPTVNIKVQMKSGDGEEEEKGNEPADPDSWKVPKGASNKKPSRAGAAQQRQSAFKATLGAREKNILYETARFLMSTCKKINITCMMYGGTLLGSWRHHDIIPWDDDIDIQVNGKHRYALFAALDMDALRFGVRSAGSRLKLFSWGGSKTSKYPWLWPYIDIHFYQDNITHIKDISKEFSAFVYEKSIIFPPHLRPLGPLDMNAPRDSYAALRKTYEGLHCETYSYSHKLEKRTSTKKFATGCQRFKDKVAFVHRSKAEEGGIKETLMLGDDILQSVVVGEPEYAVTEPYSLILENETTHSKPKK